MTDRPFELKTADGGVVSWSGRDGADAAARYVDAHRETVIVAWREPRYGVYVVHPDQIKG